MGSIQKIFQPFTLFFRSNSIGGFILLFCVAIAIIIANSPLAEAYHHFLTTNISIFFSQLNIHFLVNEVLMTVFFLLVGLEIKRELVEGELANIKQASLPILAAIGGMLLPALLYTLFNFGSANMAGWGIPMATDIAFAVAIISLLGKKVPLSLKIFLTALAIVDDLGAIVVIAIFYTASIQWTYLFMALACTLILLFLNKKNVRHLFPYLIIGHFLWYFIYQSGIHATIAGVILALTIPTNKGNKISPLEKLEHRLAKPVSFLIMPLFALVNTAIVLNVEAFSSLGSPIGLGIGLGLILGKVIGISLFTYIAILLGWSTMPTHCNAKHIIGVGFLAGIGFTMSIFIALLSFNDLQTQTTAKLAILVASIISGLVGFAILRTTKDSVQTAEPTTVQL
jgi:NhaA family Na+:H+ antiporter